MNQPMGSEKATAIILTTLFICIAFTISSCAICSIKSEYETTKRAMENGYEQILDGAPGGPARVLWKKIDQTPNK